MKDPMISDMPVQVSEAGLFLEGWSFEWYISILSEAPHTTPSDSTASGGHQIICRQLQIKRWLWNQGRYC